MSTVSKRRREDPQIRRAQILQAAKHCFRTLGFQASTVDKIAAEAQVSVGLLYRFFDSKSAMIRAIILEDIDAQAEQANAAIDGAPAGSQTSLVVPQGFAETHFDPKRIALMFEIAAEICRNPTLQTFVRERREQLKAALVKKLVGKGQKKKEALETLERLEFISAVSSGAAMHAILFADGQPEKSMQLISRYLNAIGAEVSATTKQ